MPLAPDPTSRIRRIFSKLSWLLAIAVNVAVTATLLFLSADSAVAAIVYLVLIVWFATIAGLALSVYLAITSSLLFDYFFLEPRYSLTLSGVQSWFSMIAFVVSCVIVARVAERSRTQTQKAEQRRADVESLNTLSQEMMLHGDARGLIREIPRLVEQVFAVEAVLLYVSDGDQTYSSVPGQSASGNAIRTFTFLSESTTYESKNKQNYRKEDLVFGMKAVGALAWTPNKLSPEVASAIAAQLAVAITRAHAIEASARLEAARSADRLRGALIDSMTHELRTPLTAIRAAATTLVGGQRLDEETREELATIVDEESARLDDLIGEVMEMAQLDANSIHVRPELVQVGAFLEDAIDRLHPQLKTHSVSMRVDTSLDTSADTSVDTSLGMSADTDADMSLDQPDAPVLFDPHLIGRVLHHLLENAARYTPPDSRIVLKSWRSPGRIDFSVEDDGPGIEITDRPLIFEKFYRGKHRKIAAKGSGMGLAISRAILNAHGGSIHVESMSGHGAKFHFWLPLNATQSQ